MFVWIVCLCCGCVCSCVHVFVVCVCVWFPVCVPVCVLGECHRRGLEGEFPVFSLLLHAVADAPTAEGGFHF